MRKIFKWFWIVLGSLAGLLVLAFAVLFFLGGAKVNKTYDVPVTSIAIPSDAASIQRGEHLATILICTRCHTDNLSGELSFTVPGMVSIPTPNLTAGKGGVGSFYTDEDWVRAIRHGVGHDGRGLFIMTSKAYQHLSDEDLGSLIAYLKSLTPVDNDLPERQIEPIGQLMMGAGMFPPLSVDQIDHSSQPPAALQAEVTAAYGEYLSRTCTECHGDNLNGAPFGPPGQEVPSPNLTTGGSIASWSKEQFITAMRSGMTPDGRRLNPEMPWMNYGQMTDDELSAVWMYLQSLPARAQGE